MFFNKKKRKYTSSQFAYNYREKRQSTFSRSFARGGYRSNIKPKGRSFKKIFLTLLCIAILSAGIWCFWYSSWFNISKITIEVEDNNLDTDPSFIQDYFADAYGKNLIRYNAGDIVKKIKTDHPTIKDLNIKKVFPQTLHISFKEFALAANITNINKDKISRKFIINTFGYIAKMDTENPNLTYITLKTEETLTPEQMVIDPKYLDYIAGTITLFQEKFDLKITGVEFRKIEREARFTTEKHFDLWMDLEQPFTTQLEKLRKVAGKLDIYNAPLEYIDLRIAGGNGDKIIYKRRK